MARGEWALAAELTYREISASTDTEELGALYLELALIFDEKLLDAPQALANYEQTVLLALEETETQLVRYARSRERSERLGTATDAAGEAAELARTRYRQGFIGFFEVLAAEQELIDTRDALIESRTAETLAMVNIYRALAGAPGDAAPIASAND